MQVTVRSRYPDYGGKLTMLGGGPKHALSKKLADLQAVTVRRINSCSISKLVDGVVIENAEDTQMDRLLKMKEANDMHSMPEGAQIRMNNSTGLVELYYQNERYDPKREY